MTFEHCKASWEIRGSIVDFLLSALTYHLREIRVSFWFLHYSYTPCRFQVLSCMLIRMSTRGLNGRLSPITNAWRLSLKGNIEHCFSFMILISSSLCGGEFQSIKGWATPLSLWVFCKWIIEPDMGPDFGSVATREGGYRWSQEFGTSTDDLGV